MLIPLLVLVASMFVVPVAATSTTTPLKAKHTFTGATLTAVDSDYNSKDYLIASGNQLSIDQVVAGLIIPDEDVAVDLSETSLMGDAAIDSESDFSRTLINNTYNTAVESNATEVIVDSQLSSAYADTRMDASVRFATTSAQTSIWTSDMSSDENGDGDYEDSADRSYRTSLGKSGQILYWSIYVDFNTTDTDAYVKVTWSFKTTGTNDYDFEIYYRNGNGAAAWSNIDSSGEDKVTLTLYDTDESTIALMAGYDELLQMDLGDNPVSSGLNELIVEAGVNNAAFQIDIRINNFCVFTDYPAITDGTDGDDDWDLDGGTGGLMDGVWDDNDFLITKIVSAATDTYDWTVPLREKIETSPYAMMQDVKKITFTGNFYYFPQSWSVSSVKADGFYTTTELWEYDSTTLDDFQTPANVFTWTDTYYNMTLTETVLLSGYEDFEDDVVNFEMEGTDKTEEMVTLFDAANDDNYKAAYDGTNPDASTGSSYDFTLTYLTSESYTETGGVAVTPTTDNTVLILGLGVLVLIALAGSYMFISNRRTKQRKKETAAERRKRKGQ